jgi:hypothetical protein
MMRTLCRSFWLVGICFTRVAFGSSEARPPSNEPQHAQEPSWHQAELADGLRLALARSEQSERVLLCAGLSAQALGRDSNAQTVALVDLEMRIDALAHERQRTTDADSAWRSFDRLDGDTVTLCVSVPKHELSHALSAMLDVSKPLAPSGDDCEGALGQWREHRGLAELVQADSYAARLRALTWLGSGAPEALAFSLQRIATTGCQNWRAMPAASPSPTALTIVGEIDPVSLEADIRSRRSTRQHLRAARAPYSKSQSLLKLPVQSYPRFVRLRSSEAQASTVIMGWPFIHQGERQSIGLRVIASVIERRLNRTLIPQERRATARLSEVSGYGTFEVEVRPTRSDELSSTEERVLAVIDQLRTNHVTPTEFETALTQATSPAPLSGDLELDRARRMAQKALLSWDPRAMSQPADNYPTVTDLQQWTGRLLSRTNQAELFVEAIAPRQQRGAARSEGQRPRGFAYVVRPGESLQVIARRFRVTIPELIRANHLRHPDQIAPGTRLVIPSVTPTPAPK